MHPNMPYHPVPGLVALFARVASYTQNPRASHSKPRAMDNEHFNDGNRGVNHHFGGAPMGQSSGQGASFSHGGFQPGNQGFHPSYAVRGTYSGYGGGCYGACGRLGGQPLVHHPGFAAQQGCGNNRLEARAGHGSGGVDAQGLANNSVLDVTSQ
jgi:hypothetical protein